MCWGIGGLDELAGLSACACFSKLSVKFLFAALEAMSGLCVPSPFIGVFLWGENIMFLKGMLGEIRFLLMAGGMLLLENGAVSLSLCVLFLLNVTCLGLMGALAAAASDPCFFVVGGVCGTSGLNGGGMSGCILVSVNILYL